MTFCPPFVRPSVGGYARGVSLEGGRLWLGCKTSWYWTRLYSSQSDGPCSALTHRIRVSHVAFTTDPAKVWILLVRSSLSDAVGGNHWHDDWRGIRPGSAPVGTSLRPRVGFGFRFQLQLAHEPSVLAHSMER